MTLIVECSRPIQWRPGLFKSRIIYRVWWGPFAVAWLRIPLHEFMDTRKYEWRPNP